MAKYRAKIAFLFLFFVVLIADGLSPTKGKDEHVQKKEGQASKVKSSKNKAGKITWLDDTHKIFRDKDGDIVASIHDVRKTKKDYRASKRDKNPVKYDKNHHGKINWLDEGHKIFRDHDGDIVTSIHHQRSAKKDSHYSKRDKRPAKTGKGGKGKWLDSQHKIFQDSDGDIIASLHHQRAAKKDHRGAKKDQRPNKSHSGKGKWLDSQHKIFQDSQNDIVASLHHLRAAKKDQSGAKKDQRPAKSHSEEPKDLKAEKRNEINHEGKEKDHLQKPNVVLTPEEAHRFLGQKDPNENSEVELLNLVPKKKPFWRSSDPTDESSVAMAAMKEGRKDFRNEETAHVLGPAKPLFATGGGLSFRDPVTYKPLIPNMGEHELGESRSEEVEKEANEKGKDAKLKGEEEKGLKGEMSKESKESKGDETEKEKVKEKEKEKEVEKEKLKEKEKEIEKELEEEKIKVMEEKIKQEQLEEEKKKIEELSKQQSGSQGTAPSGNEDKNVNLNIYQPSHGNTGVSDLKNENGTNPKQASLAPVLSIPNIVQPGQIPSSLSNLYGNNMNKNMAPSGTEINMHLRPGSQQVNQNVNNGQGSKPKIKINLHINEGDESDSNGQYLFQKFETRLPMEQSRSPAALSYYNQKREPVSPPPLIGAPNMVNLPASYKDNSFKQALESFATGFNIKPPGEAADRSQQSINNENTNNAHYNTQSFDQSNANTYNNQQSNSNNNAPLTENNAPVTASNDQRSLANNSDNTNNYWSANETFNDQNNVNNNEQNNVWQQPSNANNEQSNNQNNYYSSNNDIETMQNNINPPNLASSRSSVLNTYQSPFLNNYWQGMPRYGRNFPYGSGMSTGNAMSGFGGMSNAWMMPNLVQAPNMQSSKRGNFEGMLNRQNNYNNPGSFYDNMGSNLNPIVSNPYGSYNNYQGFVDQYTPKQVPNYSFAEQYAPKKIPDFVDQYTKPASFIAGPKVTYPYETVRQAPKDPLVQQRQDMPTARPQYIDTTQMVNLAQGPHREPPQEFNFPGFKLISQTYTDYNENCDCNFDRNCPCPPQNTPTQRATLPPQPPPQAAPPPRVVYVKRKPPPPPPPPKKIIKIIRRPPPARPPPAAPPAAAPPAPQPGPPPAQAPPPPPPGPCQSCNPPPPLSPPPAQAPPPPPPPPPGPCQSCQPPPPPPPPPSPPPPPPPPPCGGACPPPQRPAPNPCPSGACNQPASFTQQTGFLPAPLETYGPQALNPHKIAAYGPAVGKVPQRQQRFPAPANKFLNKISNQQLGSLNALASKLSGDASLGSDLEKLKDKLSDVVAEAIVRYKNTGKGGLPYSKNLLRNTDSLYYKDYPKVGFQRQGPAKGKQQYSAYNAKSFGSPQQRIESKFNLVKEKGSPQQQINRGLDDEKEHEKVRLDALVQPLKSKYVFRPRPVVGMNRINRKKAGEQALRVRPAENLGVKTQGNVKASNNHYPKEKVSKGKDIQKEKDDSKVYQESDVTDYGDDEHRNFNIHKGENPNGAVYKVRNRPVKNQTDEDVYELKDNGNIAIQSAQEPDFPVGLFTAADLKGGDPFLLNWRIPPTASAFSGLVAQAQVDGPSLFKLHGKKEKAYFTKEGEDANDDLDFVSPKFDSSQFFFNDPGRSLPGEALIESSNFGRVESALQEGPSVKKDEIRKDTESERRDSAGSEATEAHLAEAHHHRSKKRKHKFGKRKFGSGKHHRHHHNRRRGKRRHRLSGMERQQVNMRKYWQTLLAQRSPYFAWGPEYYVNKRRR